jgi:hypothetical protein
VQGDTARSICYLNAVHRAQGPEGLRDEMVRARYLDRLMRRAGTWRFVERTLVYDWSRVVPSDGRDWWDGATNATAVGRSDGRDPAAGFLD